MHAVCSLAIGNYICKSKKKKNGQNKRLIFGIYEMKCHRGERTKEMVK